MLSSDLRLIAERAATRDYMRARVTTVYSWDEYGVTVPGRLYEARVRTLSRSFHQVGDVVVLAAINGDPQLLVIIDAVGVGPSAFSPYPPTPAPPSYLWPMLGLDAARSQVASTLLPSSLDEDVAWVTAMASLARGWAKGITMTTDAIIGVTSAAGGGTDALVCVDIAATTVRWSIPLGPLYYGASGAAKDGYWYGTLNIDVGSGPQVRLAKVRITDGSVIWTVSLPYDTGARCLTPLDDALIMVAGFDTLPVLYRVSYADGSITNSLVGSSLHAGSQFIDADASFAVGGGQIYALCASQLGAPVMRLVGISTADLSVQWDVDAMDGIDPGRYLAGNGGPHVVDGRIWVFGGSGSYGWWRTWDFAGNRLSSNTWAPLLTSQSIRQVWAGPACWVMSFDAPQQPPDSLMPIQAIDLQHSVLWQGELPRECAAQAAAGTDGLLLFGPPFGSDGGPYDSTPSVYRISRGSGIVARQHNDAIHDMRTWFDPFFGASSGTRIQESMAADGHVYYRKSDYTLGRI